MKDNFSTHARQYAKFRPTYPDELFHFLISLITNKEAAWDCGTGNGQVAVKLSKHFKKVYATDISRRQIANARKKRNIVYKIEPAEETAFDADQFDLITVAQAIHWFDFEKFYAEVKRTLKANGVIAAIGYSLIGINPEIDRIIEKLYKEILHNYWDKERAYIDDLYRTIPFPFSEIKTPEFSSTFHWTFEELTGYLNTWSAVQHYIKENSTNPVELIKDDLSHAWGKSSKKTVNFPILTRIGHI
jgi:ubiquinone/menaquinone biosynthesis C-methylase UbiE